MRPRDRALSNDLLLKSKELRRLANDLRDKAFGLIDTGGIAEEAEQRKLVYYDLALCPKCGTMLSARSGVGEGWICEQAHVTYNENVVIKRVFTPDQVRILAKTMDVFDLESFDDDVARDV